MPKFTSILFLLIWLPAVAVSQRQYLAPMAAAQWQMTVSTPLQCRMEHAIPGFGRAVFSQSAGRDLDLQLLTQQYFKSDIDVDLLSKSPPWKPSAMRLVVAGLVTQDGTVLLEVGGGIAQGAYLGLQDGFYQSFHFAAGKNLKTSTVVTLSNVGFRSTTPDFEQCVDRLYAKSFEDIKISHIYFDSGEEFPPPGAEESALQEMLEYLSLDSAIREVVVSGHTDSSGSVCYNRWLSAQRALYIYDFLLASGVDSQRLVLKTQGESRKQDTAQSGSLSRRVTVEFRHGSKS